MNAMSNPARTQNTSASQKVVDTYTEAVRDFKGTYITPLLRYVFEGEKPKVYHRMIDFPFSMVPSAEQISYNIGVDIDDLDFKSSCLLDVVLHRVFTDRLAHTTYKDKNIRFRANKKLYDGLVRIHGQECDSCYYIAGDSCVDPFELDNGSGWGIPILCIENLVHGHTTEYVCCTVEVYDKDNSKEPIQSWDISYEFASYFDDDE